MRKAKDFTNQVIGRLTVLKRVEDKIGCYGQRIAIWQCVCECGDIVFRRSYHLNRGSCSCKTCKAIQEKKKFGFEDIRQHHWYNIQKQADKRKVPFDLTMEYAWDLYENQSRKCKLTNIPIVFAKTKTGHATGETTASLDRIDSSKGYVVGNVQWLHKWINLMKSDFDQDEFVNYCRLVTENAEKEKENAATS